MVRPSGTLTEPQAIIDSIDKLARPFLDRRKSPAGGSIVLPSLISDEIRSGFDAGGDALGREIGRCFGIDEASALSRRGRRNVARVVLRRRNPSVAQNSASIGWKRLISRYVEEIVHRRSNSPAVRLRDKSISITWSL